MSTRSRMTLAVFRVIGLASAGGAGCTDALTSKAAPAGELAIDLAGDLAIDPAGDLAIDPAGDLALDVTDPPQTDTLRPRDARVGDMIGDAALDGPVDAELDAPGTCAPSNEAPWSRRLDRAGGTVTFNEISFGDPAGQASEWIEFHNLMAVDVDLSRWVLTGDVEFTFPEGTVVRGGAQLVVTPAMYAGHLEERRSHVELRNNSGRLMDSVALDDTPLWPDVDPGYTLHKRLPDLVSARAESWQASGLPQGTMGAPNFVARRRPVELIGAQATWRSSVSDVPADPDWASPAYDDARWEVSRAPVSVGLEARPDEVVFNGRFTADNFFAVYLGGREGENLRLIGRDVVGGWDSAEDFELAAGLNEHLFAAAWEDPTNDGGPQMFVGEIGERGALPVGTDARSYEVTLGPRARAPAAAPNAAAPPSADLLDVIHAANADETWAAPIARPVGSGQVWDGALARAFRAASYVWPDTFDSVSVTNTATTYALFRTREPLRDEVAGAELASVPATDYFRTTFNFDGDPAAIRLRRDLTVDDGARVLLNGVEVARFNLPEDSIDDSIHHETLALADVDPALSTHEIAVDSLMPGPNVLAIEVHQASVDDADFWFEAALIASPPSEPILGPNVGPFAELDSDVVLSELMYHPTDGPEFIELFNRGAAPVDLSGWQFVDAIEYVFPEGSLLDVGEHLVLTDDAERFAAVYPDTLAAGVFEGGLASGGERLALQDACGRLRDEVRYFADGRWPVAADGGGSSLELRDPNADNAAAEAWAASDESARGVWEEVRYRAVASASPVGPDGQWEELVVGLFGAGTVLLDDLHVVEDPDGAATELLSEGTFDANTTPHWRFLGTHERSGTTPDPDDVENPVLRLVATGPTEHMHNHAETTLADRRRITNGRTYEVSYRARWISGNPQLNTRLYFNRLARTTRLSRPLGGGTPGARNSTFVDNLGPTFTGFHHEPAVPAPGENATIGVSVRDVDLVAQVSLWVSVDGLPFEATPMLPTEGDLYEAEVPGLAAGSLVQLYVEAEDGRGAASLFPAGGPSSRAIYRVDDGLASNGGLHNLRLLMTSADSARFHRDTNLMSNASTFATVISDEREVFYDVGVRAKGSERGRPVANRLGYSLRFGAEHPLRGVYETVSIDRSEGVNFGQRELLMDQVMAHAGAVSCEYNDLLHLMAPRAEHTGAASLHATRFSDLMLSTQFEDGSDGVMFEYELIYYPTTTDDGTSEGRKRPQPDGVVGTSLRDLGPDPESWRYNFLIKNNRSRDDVSGIMALGQLFSQAEPEFRARIGVVIDVDQWLRSFAFLSVSGAIDHYGSGAQHNAQLYVRPDDGRVLLFPHDLDFYPGDPRSPVVGSADLARILAVPGHRRRFYGHLNDILKTTYNDAYMSRWRDNFLALLPGQRFDAHHQFIVERADWLARGAPDSLERAIPRVAFEITTGGGAPLSTFDPEIVLQGTAWVDVSTMDRLGDDEPLLLTWLDDTTFELVVPLVLGENEIELQASDRQGEVVGGAALSVVRVNAP